MGQSERLFLAGHGGYNDNPFVLGQLTQHLAASKPLSEEQVHVAIEHMLDEQVSADEKADFLIAIHRKGETIQEIAAFARELRARAIEPPIDPQTRSKEILDVVGTGGDQAVTFNISTTAALVCAAAGVLVAKHGNRAATSRSGSADVLQALGVRIDLSPAEAARSLREHGFAFFFAPAYHPAFKHVAAARKLCAERGQRTIFNILGPLLNPARPSAMLVGVPRPELCEPIAQVLQNLGVRRAIVVCGIAELAAASEVRQTTNYKLLTTNTTIYLDELSVLGQTTIAEFYQERGFAASVLALDQFPFRAGVLRDLSGDSPQANALVLRRILAGQEHGPKRHAVLLNAGAALMVAGRARSISEGWELASAVIDNGLALRKLAELTAA